MQDKYRKEFMELFMDMFKKKVTVRIVNRKLKELRQLQGIGTNVYHQDLPIHDSQRMLYDSCGEDALWYTGF